MSRGSRDDPERDRSGDSGAGPDARLRDTPERAAPTRVADARWSAAAGLSLPRTPDRQQVRNGRDRVRLRDSEAELLATVGAFRVVAERDLQASPSDIRGLSEQGLLESRTIVINNTLEHVLVLTRSGQDVLEANREPDSDRDPQQYYSRLVKPRELAHDAQLYRLFETERRQLEDGWARVTRVVLDYELKRDYHAYVHRQRTAGVDASAARAAFARDHELPFVKGRIELPDVRIEYENRDGNPCHRDLELATEHYSRSQLSGKQSAGFRVYSAGRIRGENTTRPGGTPNDPHLLHWLR